MRRTISLLLALAASCSTTGNDLARFHEDGRIKPSVAIASIADSTSFDAPWNLSEELTSLVLRGVAKDHGIFVSLKEDLGSAENPFGKDLSWMKREFGDSLFVVFLELVEHDYAAVGKNRKKASDAAPFETPLNLSSAVKMRIVDLRGASPKIILQELVRDAYYIPKNTIPVDYTATTWGTSAYAASPMSLAHTQLAEEIALRISEYVHLAKSR